MANKLSRRYFFFGSMLAGAIPAAGFGSVPSLGKLGYKSPNEKLNIASIGAGGKAASDIRGCATENIVALCDVDEKRAAGMFKHYDKVPKFKDFRKMLDEQAEHRCGDRHHSRFHARHRGHVVHGARQARLRAEAADAHHLGSAPIVGGSQQI